MVSTFEV